MARKGICLKQARTLQCLLLVALWVVFSGAVSVDKYPLAPSDTCNPADTWPAIGIQSGIIPFPGREVLMKRDIMAHPR